MVAQRAARRGLPAARHQPGRQDRARGRPVGGDGVRPLARAARASAQLVRHQVPRRRRRRDHRGGGLGHGQPCWARRPGAGQAVASASTPARSTGPEQGPGRRAAVDPGVHRGLADDGRRPDGPRRRRQPRDDVRRVARRHLLAVAADASPRPVDGAGLVGYQGSPRRVIYLVLPRRDRQAADGDRQPGPATTDGRRPTTSSTQHLVEPAHGLRPRLPRLHQPATSGARAPRGSSSSTCTATPSERADGSYPPYDRDYDALPRARTLLLSADGVTWKAAPIGRRPYAVNATGSLVAAPGRHATRILSPAGITAVPVTTAGRCDFVFPVAADRLLRLHGGPHARWPRRVQLSDGHRAGAPSTRSRCRRGGRCAAGAATRHYLRPTRFDLVGGVPGRRA